jgi:hypothetical protein
MNRSETENRDTRCQSPGECLLRLGVIAKFLIRHGCRFDQVARELHIGSRVCLLALAFATAPDSLKFRALVEDWNVLAIRSSLRTLTPPFPF